MALYTPFLRLHVVQTLVVAVGGEQFVVCASFHNLSFVQHTYLVSVFDCRQAVGYCHGGACLHESLEGVLHESLALGVECRCGLVENEDGRIFEYGGCYAILLGLSAR